MTRESDAPIPRRDLKPEFATAFFLDESQPYLEFHVPDPTLDDWRQLISFLREEFDAEMGADGETVDFPASVEELFALAKEGAVVISFSVANCGLVLWVFQMSEPESLLQIGFGPEDVLSDEQGDALLEFMRQLGDLLHKRVVMVEEGGGEPPIYEYVVDTGEVRFALPTPLDGRADAALAVRRFVLIAGSIISFGIVFWLLSSMGDGDPGSGDLILGVIALFFAYLGTLPFLLYKRVVKTTSFSVIGGIALIGQYVIWFPSLKSSFHPDNPLALMWPVALAFISLLIALVTIVGDGASELIANRVRRER